MDPGWAAHQLMAIRTLMERSAVYRRALAPIMILTGTAGTLAACAGVFIPIDSPRRFIAFWLGVSAIPLTGSLILVRRQALYAAEPFWSLPTRRVTQAALPPLAAGLLISLILFWQFRGQDGQIENVIAMIFLPLAWVVLYGCALNAAGFFMPRGMKLFGWIFVLGGAGLLCIGIPDIPRRWYGHGIMGLFFGVLHLAYGVYLYFTEHARSAL
jgi:hypothetical protein